MALIYYNNPPHNFITPGFSTKNSSIGGFTYILEQTLKQSIIFVNLVFEYISIPNLLGVNLIIIIIYTQFNIQT